MNGILYPIEQVCEVLKLPVPRDLAAAPTAAGQGIMIWSSEIVPGGLRENPVVRRSGLLADQPWLDKYVQPLAASYYEERICIPGSNRLRFKQQCDLLLPGEKPLVLPLLQLTWCVHRLLTGEDLLQGNWTRLAETDSDGFRIVADVLEGRLYGDDYWGDLPYDVVFLSSFRRAS